MPAKGKTRVTDAQRRKIAAGRAAGKPRKRIAAEVGLAESTVARQLADPRTQTIALRFKHRYERKFETMYGLTLKSMEADLRSKDKALVAAARMQFMRLLVLGDPPLLRIAASDNSDGEFTLEELLSAYARAARG
ncbi:MAG: helix-turn-helix domain-containing protein [Bryobacteraceae bacterium]